MSVEIVDCRRLLCPLPVIRVQDRIEQLGAGTLVKAICSDPGAIQDIPAWCRINGHEVVETRSGESEYLVLIRIGTGTR